MIPLVLFLILSSVNHRCYAATIDGDTPTDVQTIVRHRDGRKLSLVMSDEFNKENRSFSKGMDPMFESIEKPDHSNEAIQYCKIVFNADNSGTEYVTTAEGNLIILTKAVKTYYWDDRNEHHIPERVSKNYTSGMVQSWNKFCFTGGILEMSIELPGESDSGGIWPAAWLMGNLARATFEKTTDYIWPWSYNTCGEIVDLESKQEISACDPSPGFGMNPYQGRGAPEIDIFEVMPGHEMPGAGSVNAFMSSSLQIAPGIPKSPRRPKNGRELNTSFVWYDELVVGEKGSFNSGFWGQECGPEKAGRVHKYMEDAISVNTDLEATHFKKHHVYKIEWQPGKGGYLYWYLDEKLLLGIEGESVEKLTGGVIPEEPMYLILNTAISHRWGMPEPCPVDSCSACWHCYDCTNPDCQCSLPNGMKACRNLPAQMRVDYIRLYQDATDPTHTVDCSPSSHPTADFIAAHAERYKDWEPKIPQPAVSTVQVAVAVVAALVMAGLVYLLYKTLIRPSRGTDYTPIPETAP